MTTQDMLDELFEEIKSEIMADVAQADLFSETLLRSKIKGAYREVVRARRYPKRYTEADIEDDIVNYYSNIKDLAMYDYSAVGSEGLSSYSADGTSIHYKDRKQCFSGIYPIPTVG